MSTNLLGLPSKGEAQLPFPFDGTLFLLLMDRTRQSDAMWDL